MSVFDSMSALVNLMSEPPEGINEAAAGIGKAAMAIPEKLDRIIEVLEKSEARLVEISLGLDGLADPIARPRFGVDDVAAAMSNAWPPLPPIENTITQGIKNG